MLSTSGGDSAAIDSWLLQLEENLEITIYILDKTEGEQDSFRKNTW